MTSLFTVPGLAMAGLIAVSIPIAIHLLTRFRRRPQGWAAMRFLMEAYRKHRSRLRVEQLLLLAVRCLIVLLLGLALSGPLLGAGGLGGLTRGLGLDAAGRLVVLVLDDSLSTQAAGRADHLRDQGLALLDSLRPADRVAIFQAARPTLPLVLPATHDHAAAREALTQWQPRHSRSALVETLIEADSLIKQSSYPADRVYLVVLSDFAAGAVPLDRPAPAALAGLGQRTQVHLTQPAGETANVQIEQLVPRRSMVLLDGRGVPAVSLAAYLRRYASDGAEALTDIHLSAKLAGTVVGQTRYEHRWSAGQTQAVVNVQLPVEVGGLSRQGDHWLVIEGRIDTGRQVNAVAADDQRLAAVRLRHQLRVGLIDQPANVVLATPSQPAPGQWLSAALTPWGRGPGPIELVRLPAGAVDLQAVSLLDAVMVLRPDLLEQAGWQALGQWTHGGGLAWFFTPPVQTPALWATQLRDVMGLEWSVGMEPQALGDSQQPGWSLAADTAAPDALHLLSSDWQALLRPVRISQRLVVEPGGADAQESWLRAEDGLPLLLAAQVGGDDGMVLLLTSALDADWTNLPTRPLFVPLLHETLRSLLGQQGGALTYVSGDAAADPVGAHVDEPGVLPQRPGENGDVLAVVNVDAAGGNTQSLDDHLLGQWFGRLGPWQWLASQDPGVALSGESQRANLGWPLLWAVAGLVLLETWLARWFSHAGSDSTQRQGLLGRLVGLGWAGAEAVQENRRGYSAVHSERSQGEIRGGIPGGIGGNRGGDR